MVHARLTVGSIPTPVTSVSRPDLLRGNSSAVDGVSRVVASPGQPLEHGLQAEYGRRFRRDFSGVRVHTDRPAAASATALGAAAYTRGQSIVFGPGRYSPGTIAGRRLIAHELTHVAQQDTHHDGMSGPARVDPSPSAEAGAREAAQAVDVPGGTRTGTPHSVGGGAIQRQTTDEENKPKPAAKPAPAPVTAAAPPAPDSAKPGNAPSPGFPTLPPLTLPPFPGLPRRTSPTFEPGSGLTPPVVPGLELTPPAVPGPGLTPPAIPGLGLTPPTVSGSQLDPSLQLDSNLWRDLKQPEQKGLMGWLTKRPTPPLYGNPDLPRPMDPGNPKGQFIFPGPPLKLDANFRPDLQLYRDIIKMFK
ncbi:MAG: DUF4157 domain-containing protein [Streptosporangiaceae bacterium]|jgi:hypothetical protein